MTDYAADPPDQEEVQLRIMDEQITLSRWTGYDFASDYLRPASEFHFHVGDGDLEERQRDALRLGARVRLTINSAPICDGHIDSVEISANRHAGTVYAISGRERLGLAVDAIADPTLMIKESFTLAETLKLLYTPFGWASDDSYSFDNRANRGVTNGLRGTPMTKGGKRSGPKALKNFIQHQCKPHNHEGVHDFAKRMTERHGLWIRGSEDGERIIVDVPDYEQPPSYRLRRTEDGSSNVIDGAVKFEFTNQPAAIVADGFSGGGEFGKGKTKSWCPNPYFGFDENGFLLPELLAIEQKFTTANRVYMTTQPFKRRTVNVPPRIVYLHDQESQTQDQLDNFVRREMSLYLRKALTAHYTVEGHGQTVDGVFVPWLVDTIVDLKDDVAGIDERMWVSSVTYHKSRQSGTTTTVNLIRLGSIQLGVGAAAVAGKGHATKVEKDNWRNYVVEEELGKRPHKDAPDGPRTFAPSALRPLETTDALVKKQKE